jgi:hypothetical protein
MNLSQYLNPYGYIAIGILIGAAIFYAFYRMDRKEKDNAYWRAIATEQARRDKLTAELAARSPIDYKN